METKKKTTDTLIQPAAAHYHFQGHAPTITVHGPQMCNVNDAVGQSKSRVLEDGSLTVLIEGAPLCGTPNEVNVKYAFGIALNALQREHSCDDGAVDGRGEDGFITLDGIRSVLQVVVAGDERFWHRASTGTLETTISVDQGAAWIHAVVEKKAGKYASSMRASMILLIDVRHLGKLASGEAFRAALKANHPLNRPGIRGGCLV